MNYKRMLGGFLFLLILGIAIFHNVATTHYIYWRFLWSDMVVHFCGGLWIALSSYWIFRFYRKGEMNYSLSHIAFITVGVALLVGIMWEVFEYSMGIVRYSSLYATDTSSDIFMDILGGLLGLIVAWNLEGRINKEVSIEE